MGRFINLYSNYAYRKETYELLNYFTLHIKDPEIREEFEKSRIANFARLYRPCAFFVVMLFITRLVLFLSMKD